MPPKPKPDNLHPTIDRIRRGQPKKKGMEVTNTVFAKVEANKFKPQDFVADFLAENRYDQVKKMDNEDAAALLKAKECINSYKITNKDDLFKTFTKETADAMRMLSTQIVDLQTKNEAIMKTTAKQINDLTEQNTKKDEEIKELNENAESLRKELKSAGNDCGTDLKECNEKLVNQKKDYDIIIQGLRALLAKSEPQSGDGTKVHPM